MHHQKVLLVKQSSIFHKQEDLEREQPAISYYLRVMSWTYISLSCFTFFWFLPFAWRSTYFLRLKRFHHHHPMLRSNSFRYDAMTSRSYFGGAHRCVLLSKMVSFEFGLSHQIDLSTYCTKIAKARRRKNCSINRYIHKKVLYPNHNHSG